MDKPLTLREGVKMLKKHYGPPALPATTEPFELILWENVAYLARRLAGVRPLSS